MLDAAETAMSLANGVEKAERRRILGSGDTGLR
jgi:hypothetical protein